MDLPYDVRLVPAAFPEYQVDPSPLGVGGQKAAFAISEAGQASVLKILHEPVGDDDGALLFPERFAREIIAMKSVSCPNVVQVRTPPAVREVAGEQRVFYTEPLYPGPTLKQDISDGRFGADLSRRVLRDVSTAIEALSSIDVVHRDIKPGNIVCDADGNLVLIDLGISRHLKMDDITESFAIAPMTSRYAAPEQFKVRRNAEIDFRTDLYLLGIVAFEAATGRHPFWYPNVSASDYFGAMARISVADLDGCGLGVNECRIIIRLLAEYPSRRYRTMSQFSRALNGA